jgi:multiple sugar transport system substrate-binding protein
MYDNIKARVKEEESGKARENFTLSEALMPDQDRPLSANEPPVQPKPSEGEPAGAQPQDAPSTPQDTQAPSITEKVAPPAEAPSTEPSPQRPGAEDVGGAESLPAVDIPPEAPPSPPVPETTPPATPEETAAPFPEAGPTPPAEASEAEKKPAEEAIPPSPPPPKKAFPKKIVLIIAVILLVPLLGLIAWKALLPKVKLGRQAELTWWGLWEDEVVVKPLIEEYQKEHPKVKIKYVKQSHQDYRERLTNALARGTGPDIFRFHNTWVPMFRNELDSVPPSVMSPAEYAKTYYPVISSDMTSGTGLVGIPLGYDALTLYINEDIFAAAGKSPPTTWDDLRKLAIELTAKDEQGTIRQAGVALGEVENVEHWPEILGLMMVQNGVNLANPTGKLAEDALNYYLVFSSVDGVWDTSLPPSTIAFANGKLAMYFGTTWRAFEIKNMNPDLRFRAVSLPQLPKDSPDLPDVVYASYWVEGVWKRSENKEAAWDFLKFLSSKESLEKMYQNASKTRLFGEPYPRTDMRTLLIDHPIVGAMISEATNARSWYLVSRTFDGPTGINSQITSYFEDAINAIKNREKVDKALETVASGVYQILSQYGLQIAR